MRLVIVTGMSGAGKTIALKMLEDMGFYCVDNLPIPLIEKFAELSLRGQNSFKQVALGIDIRSGEELSQLDNILTEWNAGQPGGGGRYPYQILFLDASDAVLIKRYKETRRSHPLAGVGRIDQGIVKEREKLEFLKQRADFIIDTSQLLTKELRQELEKIFVENHSYYNLFVTVLSFGFKYGIPADADLVFDVRFLPNPYYIEDLRPRTGETKEVQDFVMQGDTGTRFLEKLGSLLDFLIPNYVLEGKNQLVIAIGCTGGKHRSVTIAGAVYEHLKTQQELGVKLEHRDIDRDNKIKART
ncbi:MAG: RNase adapter RapZ [Hungatella hathewayi]|nr:RNase adapter RapZ [Hungatella hathewayi]